MLSPEEPELGAPADYKGHHPTEHPSQWGWHADFGTPARIGGWLSVICLVLMVTATHYNGAGTVALLTFAGLIVVGLLWDIQRRRTSWRQ
ncbi:MAG: DUF2631 domain-containing protein [Actinobacteria bacterium]|nr:DUF2631 domain-containing protein [Actinomycetota bacterium]